MSSIFGMFLSMKSYADIFLAIIIKKKRREYFLVLSPTARGELPHTVVSEKELRHLQLFEYRVVVDPQKFLKTPPK